MPTEGRVKLIVLLRFASSYLLALLRRAMAYTS